MYFGESELTQMAVYALASFLACFIYAIWDYLKNRDFFSPGVWLPLVYFFFYYNGTCLILIFGEESFHKWQFTAWENLPYSLLLNTIGIVGLLAGLSVVQKNSKLALKLPDLRLRDRRHAKTFLNLILSLAIALLVINYYSYLDLIEFGFEMSPEQLQWLILTTLGTWFSCCFLEAALILGRRNVFGFILLANLALALVALLGFETRNRLLFIVMFLVSLAHYDLGFKFIRPAGVTLRSDRAQKLERGYRFPAVPVLAMALIIFSVSIFKNIGGLRSESIDLGSQLLKDHITGVFWALDYNGVLTHEIDHYADGQYEYGRTMIEGMLRKTLPVSLTGIYLFEPIQFQYQRYMEAKVGSGDNLGIGLDYALNAEGYVNFGFLGVGVMMFVVATIIKLFYVKYIVHRQTGQQGYSLISPYLLMLCTPDIFRREFSSFGHLWFSIPLILWGLVKIADMLRRRD